MPEKMPEALLRVRIPPPVRLTEPPPDSVGIDVSAAMLNAPLSTTAELEMLPVAPSFSEAPGSIVVVPV